MESRRREEVFCTKCGRAVTALMSLWSVGMVSKSLLTKLSSHRAGLIHIKDVHNMVKNETILEWLVRSYLFVFCSPLLGSVISKAGPGCGGGGQVIYLHAAEAEVIFVFHSVVRLVRSNVKFAYFHYLAVVKVSNRYFSNVFLDFLKSIWKIPFLGIGCIF